MNFFKGLCLFFAVTAFAGQPIDEEPAILIENTLLQQAQNLLNLGQPHLRILDLEADAREEMMNDLELNGTQRDAVLQLFQVYGVYRSEMVDALIDSLLWEQSFKQKPNGDLAEMEALYADRDALRDAHVQERTLFFEEFLSILDQHQQARVLPQTHSDGEPPFEPLAEDGALGKRANWCTSKIMIINGDQRYVRDTCPKYVAPWRNVGRLSIGCSATLIGSRHVLTAAHCLIDGNGNFRSANVIYFKLARYNSATTNYQTPYGTYYVKRAIVPSEYAETNDPEDRSFEYALLELDEEIPGAVPMAFDYLDWVTTRAKTSYTVGYPGSATGRWNTKPLVGGAGSALQDHAARWLNGGDSGLLVHSLDAEGGQSGSPIYVFHNGVRTLIGVMVGSPVSECEQGRVWGSRITSGAEDRIQAWMANFYDNTWSAKRKNYTVIDPYAPNSPGCTIIISAKDRAPVGDDDGSVDGPGFFR